MGEQDLSIQWLKFIFDLKPFIYKHFPPNVLNVCQFFSRINMFPFLRNFKKHFLAYVYYFNKYIVLMPLLHWANIKRKGYWDKNYT